MATYAIGDVQGCDDELGALLTRIKFNPALDQLWLVGDLVNRGMQSLEVLRRVKALGERAVVVLGNHDLHLLAQWYLKPDKREANADLGRIYGADDGPELIDWLRSRSLAHYDPKLHFLMVHAGLHPDWDIETTLRLARRVEAQLRGPKIASFLARMYGNRPAAWSAKLKGAERMRAVVNTLTRMRFCDQRGNIAFDQKGPPGSQPVGFYPWYEVPGLIRRHTRIVFGHWSALGRFQWDEIFGIDTGCVWGGELTALELKRIHPRFISVKAKPR